MDLIALTITKTWLTGNVSGQKSISAFRYYQLTFGCEGISVRVSIIYRLYRTKKNGLKATDFLKQFSEFVGPLDTYRGHFLILRNFNIHWDCKGNADSKYVADILRFANLGKHVQERTHRHGHLVDIVISRDDDYFIKDVSVFYVVFPYKH